MIFLTETKLAKFAEKNRWILIEEVRQQEKNELDHKRYLTPSGRRVLVKLNKGICFSFSDD